MSRIATKAKIRGSIPGVVVVGLVVGVVGDVTIAPAVNVLSDLSELKYMPSVTCTRTRYVSLLFRSVQSHSNNVRLVEDTRV